MLLDSISTQRVAFLPPRNKKRSGKREKKQFYCPFRKKIPLVLVSGRYNGSIDSKVSRILKNRNKNFDFEV